MSKFNLEAAKRGEQVQFLEYDDKWVNVHFIGIDTIGNPVFETNGDFNWVDISSDRIRMKPKKREMWAYPRKLCDENVIEMSGLFLSEEAADKSIDECKQSGGIILGKPQMILVDEE